MDFIPPPMPPAGMNDEELKKKGLDEKQDSERRSSSSDHEMTDDAKRALSLGLKTEGLNHFSNSEWEGAISKWKEAIQALKGATGEESTTIRTSLHANLCLVYLKSSKWSDCVTECSLILRTDPNNPKALYRRAKANLEGLKHGVDAKDDLLVLIKRDPSNKEYRKMYDEALELAKKEKAEEKARMTDLFSKPGLYDDKEKLRKKREEEAKVEAAKKKRDFEDEMSKRAIDGRDVITFEDWEKEEQKKKDELAKKKREARTPQKTDKSSVASVKTSTAAVDSDDYTEEEKKILEETKKKGYCYFKNSELSPEERAMKQKINQNAPTKLKEDVWTPEQAGAGTGLSSWNSAGTSYEEKDMTKWAKDCVKSLLLDCKDVEVAGGLLSFVKVPQLEGEANAAVVRGTNRYFYDLEVKIEYNFVSIEEGSEPSVGEISFQPTNVITSTDLDSPDWLTESRCFWRTKNIDDDTSTIVFSKIHEMILCLVKGFEGSFSELVNK